MIHRGQKGRSPARIVRALATTAAVWAVALTSAPAEAATTLTVDVAVTDKTYDTTDAATVTLSLVGVDPNFPDVQVTYTTATFSDENAGVGKTVTVSGLALTGADAANYDLGGATQAFGSGDIDRLPFTPKIIAFDRVYDNTTTAPVDWDYAFMNAQILPGDTFSFDSATRTFADEHAGTNKTVTVVGIFLVGGDSANYELTTTVATDTADIFTRPITVTAVTDSRQYDGTTASAGVPTVTLGSIAGGDTGTFTQTFDTRHAGSGKTLTPAGSVSDGNGGLNYAITFAPVATGEITQRPLTVTATAADKVFDGNADAVATLSSDKLAIDTVTLSYTTASFANAFVGTGKTVTVSGISIGGAHAGNYALQNTTAFTTASITPVLGVDAAQHAFDSTNGALLYGGATVYVIPGDFDGDGDQDVAHFTSEGVQILRNDGVMGSDLVLTLTQEMKVRWSKAGGAFDMDGDGDLDLVMGEVDRIMLGTNDGTGVFALSTLFTHGFAHVTIAQPFDTRANPSDPGNEIRILLAASADKQINTDLVNPPADGNPHLYVLGPNGLGGYSLLQTLGQYNLDGVLARDLDSDGDNDLVACNRTDTHTTTPFFVYQAGGSYAAVGGIDFSTFYFGFSYGPTDQPGPTNFGVPVSYPGIGVGSWHRVSLYPGGIGSFGAPTHIALDPNGAGGWNSSRVAASAFADMNWDGTPEVVTAGTFTPMMLIRIDAGDPNSLANRHVTPAVVGSTFEVAVDDWDNDGNDAPDVLVGRSNGLWYYHNKNGGAPGSGVPVPPPPPPTAGENLAHARDLLYAALDPSAVNPIGGTNPTFPNGLPGLSYYDDARMYATRALAELNGIDLAYTSQVPNVIYGATDLDQVETLRRYWNEVDDALDQLALAVPLITDPADLLILTEVQNYLLQAQIGIVAQAQAIPPGYVVPKRATRGGALRFRKLSLQAQGRMIQSIASARITTDTGDREQFIRQGTNQGRQSLNYLVRYLRSMNRGSRN